MATTVLPGHVAPCELKNNSGSYCIGETTTCNLNSSIGVVGYSNMDNYFDPMSTSALRGSDNSKLPRQKSQLTTIQSHRVGAVLYNIIDRLKLLACTTPDVQQHGIKLSMLMGEEICASIQEHKSLQQQHESLIREQRLVMKGAPLSDEMKKQEIQSKISQLKCNLQEKTSLLYQKITDTPDVSKNMQKIHKERDKVIALLEKLTREVTDNCTFSMLTRWLDGNTAMEKYRSDVTSREKEAAILVNTLHSKLHEVTEENKREKTKQRWTLNNIRETKTIAQDRETEEADIIKKKYIVSVESKLQDYEQEQKEKRRQLRILKKKMEDEMVLHKTSMVSMERRSKQIVDEAQEWEHRRLFEHGKLSEELEVLTKEKKELFSKLAHLKQRYAEEEKKKKIRTAELERIRQCDEAAIIIQRFFKFYSNKRSRGSNDQSNEKLTKKKKKNDDKKENGKKGKAKVRKPTKTK